MDDFHRMDQHLVLIDIDHPIEMYNIQLDNLDPYKYTIPDNHHHNHHLL